MRRLPSRRAADARRPLDDVRPARPPERPSRRRSGSTQRSAPSACFLSVASALEHRRDRVGQGLGREPERRQQPLDPVGPLGRRHAERPPDPDGAAQPVGDRLAVEEVAEAAGRLDRVAERVPEVQRDPAVGGALLLLVGVDDRDLRPRRPLDELGHGARRRTPRRRRAAIAAPSRSSRANSRSSPRAAIFTASPRAARRWRSGRDRSERDVDDDRGRRMERADEVLALGQVDPGLAADRRVDLGDERRRHLDERDAAQPARGEEAGGVAERAAPDRHERLAALGAQPGQLARGVLDDRHPLGALALRQEDRLDRPAVVGERRRDRLAGRRPRAGLRDEDRAAGAEAAERVRDDRRRDALADHEIAAERVGRGGAPSARGVRDPADQLVDRARRSTRSSATPFIRWAAE